MGEKPSKYSNRRFKQSITKEIKLYDSVYVLLLTTHMNKAAEETKERRKPVGTVGESKV